MELRRSSRVGAMVPAIRLAIMLSVAAVVAATILHTLGISQTVIVLGTIVVGFATSWVRSGQQVRPHPVEHRARHHVSVPTRGVHFPVS